MFNLKGEVAIYLRITVDGVSSEISTKHFIGIDKWNSSKGRLKGNTELARTTNHSLAMLEGLAHKHYNELLYRGKLLSPIAIKNAILGLSQKNIHSLLFLKNILLN